MFWELEGNLFTSELLVDVGISLQLVLNVSLHRFVQMDLKWNFRKTSFELIGFYLQETGGVKSDTGTLADDLSWEAQVLQDRVVDGGQGTAVWTLLLLVLCLTGWLG